MATKKPPVVTEREYQVVLSGDAVKAALLRLVDPRGAISWLRGDDVGALVRTLNWDGESYLEDVAYSVRFIEATDGDMGDDDEGPF
jgi:hypothetical protein